MGLIHEEKTYGIKIRESANDGSDFTNPDVDYRLAFLGEDGLWHVKDSAGAVTSPYSSGSGALALLETRTASASATLDFTTFISSTYDDYIIRGLGICPATDAASLMLQVGTGVGPTYDTGNNYVWGASGISHAGNAYADSGATGAGARMMNAIDNGAGYGFGTFDINASNLQSTALRKAFHGTVAFTSSATPRHEYAMWGMNWITDATAVTALRFLMSSGNITSGIIRAYGVVK